MPFAENANRRALLNRWIEDVQSNAGTALLREVETEYPKGGADSIRSELIRELGDEEAVVMLTDVQCLSMLNRLYARDQRKTADAPTIRRVMDDVRSRLRDNSDYQGDVRCAFDMVLVSQNEQPFTLWRSSTCVLSCANAGAMRKLDHI